MNIFLDNLPFLPLATVLMSSFFCLLFPKNYSRYISIIFIAIALILAFILLFKLKDCDYIIYNFGGWKAPIGIEYKIDHLNIVLILILLLISFVILFNKIELENKSYPIFLLAIAGFSGMCFSNDIFNIYVFMEIASIASYILVVNDDKKNSSQSALNYLIIGSIATSFILLGIGLIYIEIGSLNFTDIHQKTQTIKNSIPILYGCTLIILGLIIKIGAFPFNAWLFDVYNNAPIIITSFFIGAANKIYIYLILKFVTIILLPGIYLKYLMYISLIGIIISSILAYNKKDMQLLVYSSVVQLSYIIFLISISYDSDLAIFAIFTSIINHALVKTSLVMLLFNDDISDIIKCNPLLIEENQNNKLCQKQSKYIKLLLFLNLASLAGLPLSLGFVFKWQLFFALVNLKNWLGFTIIVFSSFIFIFYYYRIWEGFDANLKSPTKIRTFPITILTSANIIIAFYSNSLISWIK